MKTRLQRLAHIIARAPIVSTNTAYTATSSAAVQLNSTGTGAYLVVVTPTTNCYIKFGESNMPAAAAADFPLEAGVEYIFEVSTQFTGYFRVVRQTADGSLNWYIPGKVT